MIPPFASVLQTADMVCDWSESAFNTCTCMEVPGHDLKPHDQFLVRLIWHLLAANPDDLRTFRMHMRMTWMANLVMNVT